MKKLLITILITFLLLPTIALADDIKVGTYILNVGEYNTEVASYVIDFYLWFKWDGDVSPEQFEFMNGRARHIDLMIDEPGYKFYRIEAELYENTNLRDYPLDKQVLSIRIEDKIKTIEELNYVPDHEELGISPELSIMTWRIIEDNAYVKNVEYPNWDETYSRYIHEVKIERPWTSIIRILIPVIFIAITGWLCFFFPLHKMGEKLALIGTALLSAVVIHLFMVESIPAVGYMTLADKIAMSLYTLLVFTIIGIVLTEVHIEKKTHKQSQKTNKKCAILSIIAAIVMFIILTLI